MDFLDRTEERTRLRALLRRGQGGFAVIYGRRRVGKTRLLLDWVHEDGGLYSVADQSSPVQQRAVLAESIAQKFSGFADVTYPTWASLFARLAETSVQAKFRGPVVLDELPYLVAHSPELPSVLQRFIDHDAKNARLTVVIAGSSQRMMQGLVLSANAPLFGRATEHIHLGPLPSSALRELGIKDSLAAIAFWTAWGGIPRYWELAENLGRNTANNILDLVLDPQGPLHLEPTRLLLEEQPPAVELKPILDAIGVGAHRLSEIAGRMGRPATSLGRAFERLIELGLVRRETPFGESELSSKRSLYHIDDPFLRLWFRTVSGNRAALTGGTRKNRQALLAKHWPGLVAACWEELGRSALARLPSKHGLAALATWGPARRWWQGSAPEWDAVSADESGSRLLVAEAKWSEKQFTVSELTRLARALLARPVPKLSGNWTHVERALIVPTTEPRTPRRIEGVWLVTGKDVLP